MTAAYCKYHPSIPARWQCMSCRSELCSRCIKNEYLPEPTAMCPACDSELREVAASNLITPFWQRIPRFFAYPFNPGTLVYFVVLAAASTILFRPTLMGLLLQVVPFLVFLRYAYGALTHTALGHMEPPSIDFSMVNEGLEMPFKQLGVYIFIGIAFNLLFAYVGILAALYLLMMLVCIPATAMMIAIENSFLRAINPLALISLIARIGWPYLVLCIFLLILWGGANVVMGVITVDDRSLYVALFVYNLASMYFMLVMFHMMGYVIYQYHEELGFEVDVDAEEQIEYKHRASGVAATASDHPAIREAEVLVKEGKITEAITTLENASAVEDQNLEIHERLHRLLKLEKHGESLLDSAPKYIHSLLQQDQTRRAADVFADVFALAPSFKLSTPDQVLPIATELKQAGRAKAALAVMDGFAKKNPNHKDIPDVYFLAAKILCEDFKQDQKAKGILERLLARYPQHPVGADIRVYLTTIEKLAL